MIPSLILQVFHGNSGRNDTVKHNLKEIARARFIQFQPTTYSTYKALRVEVFGIRKPAGILLPTIVIFHISAMMVIRFSFSLLSVLTDNELILDHLPRISTTTDLSVEYYTA